MSEQLLIRGQWCMRPRIVRLALLGNLIFVGACLACFTATGALELAVGQGLTGWTQAPAILAAFVFIEVSTVIIGFASAVVTAVAFPNDDRHGWRWRKSEDGSLPALYHELQGPLAPLPTPFAAQQAAPADTGVVAGEVAIVRAAGDAQTADAITQAETHAALATTAANAAAADAARAAAAVKAVPTAVPSAAAARTAEHDAQQAARRAATAVAEARAPTNDARVSSFVTDALVSANNAARAAFTARAAADAADAAVAAVRFPQLEQVKRGAAWQTALVGAASTASFLISIIPAAKAAGDAHPHGWAALLYFLVGWWPLYFAGIFLVILAVVVCIVVLVRMYDLLCRGVELCGRTGCKRLKDSYPVLADEQPTAELPHAFKNFIGPLMCLLPLGFAGFVVAVTPSSGRTRQQAAANNAGMLFICVILMLLGLAAVVVMVRIWREYSQQGIFQPPACLSNDSCCNTHCCPCSGRCGRCNVLRRFDWCKCGECTCGTFCCCITSRRRSAVPQYKDVINTVTCFSFITDMWQSRWGPVVVGDNNVPVEEGSAIPTPKSSSARCLWVLSSLYAVALIIGSIVAAAVLDPKMGAAAIFLAIVYLVTVVRQPLATDGYLTWAWRVGLSTVMVAMVAFNVYIAQQQSDQNTWAAVAGSAIPPSSVPYPACSQGGNLSLVERCFMAAAAYRPPDVLSQQFGTWFNATPWSLVEVATNGSTQDGVSYFVARNSRSGQLAVVTRGTYEKSDWLSNADIWKEAAVAQIASWLPPMAMLPLEAQIAAVKALSQPAHAFSAVDDTRFVYSLKSVVQDVIARFATNNVVLIGHSLGGGLSAIVGHLTGLPATSFNGPGWVLSGSARFGITDALDSSPLETVIIPDLDVVPRIDVHNGNVQSIRCNSKDPLACHSIVRVCCELVRSCGDPRGRTFQSCPGPSE